MTKDASANLYSRPDKQSLFSGPPRRGRLMIGTRLTSCFVVIVLLMLTATLVAAWQFRRMEESSRRLSQADQISLAAMVVHLDIDTLRNRLTGIADTSDGPEFAREAGALRQKLLEDVNHAQQLFIASSDIQHDPVILSTLQTLQVTLPSQVDSVMGLAAMNDWPAVRIRLTDQVQGLLDLSSLLVERVDGEVSQQREEAIDSAQRAGRQLLWVLPAAALSTMLIAVLLGWYVTRSITEPLTELSNGAHALAQGEFQHEVKVAGEDELATLGNAFNYAARRLYELYDGLRDSEELWRAAFESNPTMYFMVDRAGIIVSVNLFGAQQLGYSVAELFGQPVLNVFYEADRDAAMKHADDCFEEVGKTVRWEARNIRKNGSMLWVRQTANAVFLKKRPVLLIVCEDITEQKRAEEVARRSENELRDLIENLPAMVFISLPGPANAFTSRRWREYTGLSEEDTIGFGWQSVVHTEDIERHMEAWRKCSATSEPFEDEARFRRAEDGVYRWFLIRAVPLRNEIGNVVKWYGVLTDIEDRKQAEERIRRSEAELRQLVDVIPQQVFVFDADWNPLFANRRELEYTGLTSLEMQSRDAVARVFHPEDLKSLNLARERARSDSAPLEIEARIRGRDGAYRWFLVRDSPLRDERGRVLRWYGTRTDIEDRKRAEEALRRSEAYLADAQRLTHTGSWAYKAGRGAAYLSEETFRIWGFDPEQGLPDSETVLQRIHPDDRESVIGELESVLRDKRDSTYEYRIVLPDGAVRHISAIAHPVFNASGEAVELVGTHVDVTDRKRAEEESERLRRLEADLARINRMTVLGELASSIAHELNQPIAAAITSANTSLRWLTRNPPDLDRARAAIMRIEKDGIRAAEIIQRLRAFYKTGTPPQLELVDINEVIDEMLVLLRDEAIRHSILMHTELAASLPQIMADRVQIQQVLMNLMLNGIEAMRDGTGDLTIRSQSTDNGLVLISVSDTGVGLPSENVEQIFNAFYTTKPQGTGMGLAISRSIIEAHNGRLWATANAERGATFHFTVPAAVQD